MKLQDICSLITTAAVIGGAILYVSNISGRVETLKSEVETLKTTVKERDDKLDKYRTALNKTISNVKYLASATHNKLIEPVEIVAVPRDMSSPGGTVEAYIEDRRPTREMAAAEFNGQDLPSVDGMIFRKQGINGFSIVPGQGKKLLIQSKSPDRIEISVK